MSLAEAATFAFRAILDAMANPGRILPPPEMPSDLPPLSAPAAAVLLSLLDSDTPVYVDPSLATDDLVERIRFQTGARFVGLAEASFAVLPASALAAAAEEAGIGTPEYPDRSATLIVEVDAFDGPVAARLAGPGIPGAATLAPNEIDPAGWDALIRNAALYPLGFDTILTAPDGFAALPRSTKILLEER